MLKVLETGIDKYIEGYAVLNSRSLGMKRGCQILFKVKFLVKGDCNILYLRSAKTIEFGIPRK